MNKDLNFEYIEDFADYIVNKVENDEDLFVTIIGKFEEIKYIIKELVCVCEVDFEKINLSSPDVNGYFDEYILDCWYNDGVVEIGCEPAKGKDGKYLGLCGDETYLLDNCSSKIIPLCEDTNLYFVNIDEELNCDEYRDCCCQHDCCENEVFVECSTDKDGNPYGFTANKTDDNGYYTFSYRTNAKLSEKDICDMLEEFGF